MQGSRCIRNIMIPCNMGPQGSDISLSVSYRYHSHISGHVYILGSSFLRWKPWELCIRQVRRYVGRHSCVIARGLKTMYALVRLCTHMKDNGGASCDLT